MIKNILLICLLLWVNNATAQTEKIDTDRPDQTESPFTVPKKWFQFEMGFNKQRNSDDNHEYLLPTLLSKYGISNKMELRLITEYQSTSSMLIPQGTVYTKGIVPVAIGAKIGLSEEKGLLPKTSLIFHVVLPKVASKKLAADKVAPNFRFTMQNSLTKTIGLGYNIGAEWDGFTNTPTWIYTFAPGFNLSEKWYAYIEAFGFISKAEAPQHSIDGGIAYYFNNNIKIDFSGGFGISEAAPKNYVALGLSFRFKAGK